MTINNKSERNYRGKCLGSPVTSYGGDIYERNQTCSSKKELRERIKERAFLLGEHLQAKIP